MPKTFEEIWEKDAQWLSGRQILTSVIEELRDKSIVIAHQGHGQIVLRLPLPMVDRGDGVEVYQLIYQVPETLEHVLIAQIQTVLGVFFPTIVSLIKPFEGMRLDPRTIAEINQQIADREREFAYSGYPTLADAAAVYLGLPHLSKSLAIQIKAGWFKDEEGIQNDNN